VRRFEVRGAITALGASATAISVSRVILGDAPDFHVSALVPATAATRPLFFVLGALAGSLRSGITCCCCERWRCLTG